MPSPTPRPPRPRNNTPGNQPSPQPASRPDFQAHPASLDDAALLKQCTTRRTRASGPGGQHRNKVETAIELTHQPTDISAAASERRSQADNHRIALKRLRLKLAIQFRTPRNTLDPANPPGTPGASDLWQSRTQSRRIVISADHADFPVLLAEALDTLAALNYDTPQAAAVLGVTGSQLVKLFQKEPAVLARVNAERAKRGLRLLR